METKSLTIQGVSVVLILCLFGVAFLTSCAGSKLERAFTPKMESRESNKTISEYCITCHTHKNLEPSAHIKQARVRNNTARAGAAECRACHTYTKTWLLDVRRKTLRTAEQ